MDPEKRGTEYVLPPSEYQKLVTLVASADCFERTYLAHLAIALMAIGGLGLSTFVVTVTDTLWVQLLNACFAAFFTVQLGLLGHDFSHNSVFKSRKINNAFALTIWGLGCGLSEGRWFSKHNAHHQSPNQIGHDPDVDIPFVFTHEQALLQSAFYQKLIFPYQHVLFWVGIWFVYPYNLINSMKYLFRDLTWRSLVEIFLILAHFVFVLGFTFWFLPPVTAFLFNLVTAVFAGGYMAMIFAPNHKGEDMLAPHEKHNWVHQITLTRNIVPSPLVTYILGGLNRQIEHHLFPTMSRFQYHSAQPIVKSFCTQHNIPYKETSWVESMRQIHSSLEKEAQQWR